MADADPTSETLGLPPGGGAVAASGTDFDIDLNTGTAGLGLPLDLPTGPNGIRPELTLRYHSGAGGDWLGIGWTLGMARIVLRDGRPALEGVGTLWPGLDGSWAPEVDTFGQRILGDQNTGWRLVDHSDTVHSLGTTSASRLVDGAGRPVAWLLDSVTDCLGNAVVYGWEQVAANLRVSTVTWGRYQVRMHYQDRPDVLADGRLGVLTTIRSRLADLELHRMDLGTASRLRSWRLEYDDGGGRGRSVLRAVRQFADDPEGGEIPAAWVEFGWTDPGVSSLRVLPRLPVAVRGDGIQFVDLDGDGRPDLLDYSGRQPRWWRNGAHGFEGPHQSRAVPGPVRASPGTVAFADVDGDGAADVVVLAARFSGFYPLDANSADAPPVRGTDPVAAPFGRPVMWRRAPSVRLDDPLVRLLDLDGDGRADLLLQRGDRWLAWLQDQDNGWAREPIEIFGTDRPPVGLGDVRVTFADITGGGGLDVVKVTGTTVTYWPRLGPRRWGAAVTVTIPEAPRQIEPRRVVFADVDGDGCADLVYVDSGRVLVWRWAGCEQLAPPTVIDAVPPTGPGRFRLLDLDGTGVPGLLLDLPGGRQGYLHLLGAKPYLLDSIVDASARTELMWRTSTTYADDDRAAGADWRTFHPFPLQCVAQVTTTDAATGRESVTRYHYREAHFDPLDGALAGFAVVVRDDIGDDTMPTSRRTSMFHVGVDPDDPGRPLSSDERRRFGALRHKPIVVTVRDPAADHPETVIRYQYAVRERALVGGRRSLLPYAETVVEERWEGQPAPVSTHTINHLEVDDAGTVLRQRSVVQRPGSPPDRDVEIRRWAATGGMNLRLPCRTQETDATGEVLADTITYYDGPPEQGLPLGTADHGLLTRIEDLVLTDELVGQIWGGAPPDLSAAGYHRLSGETGWWVARTRLTRDPAEPAFLWARGPLGGVCTTELDPTRHDVVAVTDALGHRRVVRHDPRTGTITALTDAGGGVRRESFDPLGRVTAYWGVRDATRPLTTWSYDTSAMPIKVIATGAAAEGDPVRSVSHLDGRGGLLVRLVPTGNAALPWLASGEQRLCARGSVAASFPPHPVPTDAYRPPTDDLPHRSFRYDATGRPLRETHPDGTTLTWDRSPGCVIVSLQPPGAPAPRPRERHLTDACGQVVSVGRFDGTRWVEQTYTWDHRGRPVTVTTPDGVEHRLMHDLLGRLVSHSSPDHGTTRRLIDAVGDDVQTLLATGAAVVREFDALRRPTKVWRSGSGAPDVVREYLAPGDPAPADGERNRTGRLWRVTDPLGTVTLAYDGAGRLTSTSRTTPELDWPVDSDAEYDATGRLMAVVLPATGVGGPRRRVEYTYDSLGRPAAAPGVVDGVTFDLHGRTAAVHFANGVVADLSYDAMTGQVIRQTLTSASGVVLRDHLHHYDDEHRLTGTDAGADDDSWAYAFDGLGRLATATRAEGTLTTFGCTDGGNLVVGPFGTAQTYQPGTSRLATIGDHTYTYDVAGRLVSAPWGTASWDAEDNLTSVTTPDGTRIEHVYDHTGVRVLSRRNGIHYYLQASEDLRLTDTGTTVTIRFAGVVVATADHDGVLHWLHPDVLGNVTLVTAADGTAAARLALDPWGNLVDAAGSAAATGFLGQQADPTGLVCLGRRWYDPRTGRFLSTDPLVGGLFTLGAWNAYSYGLNNPVLLSDPSGLLSVLAVVGLALVVAVVVTLAVATCGAAFAGVTVFGMTFAGFESGTLAAVGIGAFGGALAGGMGAARAGGTDSDVLLGAVFGGLVGGATALVGGAIGAVVVREMGGVASWASYLVSGAVQGEISGFGSGLASGFAGGRGTLWDMMLGAARGASWGALFGAAAGGLLGKLFANSSGSEHNYLEFGTLHKYGLMFGSATADVPTANEIVDNVAGSTIDTTLAVSHGVTGQFSLGGDIFGNVIDVADVPRDVGGLFSSDPLISAPFFTTDVPGALFAVDANAIASAVATNGVGGALASASVGADAAGFSYADQIMLGLKGVPYVGNVISLYDAFGKFDSEKRGVNRFLGSSSPDT